MIVWLLVLLLLVVAIYVVYRLSFSNANKKKIKRHDQHYTFKL